MAVSFNDTILMAGGRGGSGVKFYNDVWSTSDGATWTQLPTPAWGPRAYHIILELDQCIFVMGGQTFGDYFGDVWRSCDDGMSWTQTNKEAWPVRAGLAATTFNGEMVVAGGCFKNSKGRRDFYNDVWSSADGVTWTELTPSASWSGRSGPRLVVLNEMLFLVAGERGFTDDTQLSSVYASKDGAEWALVTDSPLYTPRSGHGVVVQDNKMVLIAGWPELHDLYSSTDGKNWELLRNDTWGCGSMSCGKYDFWSLTHKGSIYTLGGSGATSTFGKLYQDTWIIE